MIIYQVYPRSFNDANGDGVGDLKGLLYKLEYIKSLGVDGIWISPFFKSPMKDFGYDVSDYRAIDPLFGSLDDFKEVLNKSNELGLAVIIDMVISHTSEEHEWFKVSRSGSGDKRDWYLWANAKADGTVPNNWLSVFGGSAWQWDANRRQYYYHTFLTQQPDLNMHNLEVQAAIFGEMEFWLQLGVKGFRLDACNHYFQDLLLRDNPARDYPHDILEPYGFQYHQYDQAQPEMLEFLEKVRGLLNQYGAFSLAEVGGDNVLELMGQYTQPHRLHSAYSFALMNSDNSAQYIASIAQQLEAAISKESNVCYALSNHDKPRVASRWLHGRNREEHAKAMLALLMCLRGDICIYQGEELGLPEAEVPFEKIQDPYGKAFWPEFKGRDGCRTPIPWSDKQFGGFSEVEPWLPVPVEHILLSVANQEHDSNSCLHFARKIINLRQSLPALSQGTIEFLDWSGDLLFFSRYLDGDKIYCLFNLGHEIRKQDWSFLANSHDRGDLVTDVVFSRHIIAIEPEYITLGVSGFCMFREALSRRP